MKRTVVAAFVIAAAMILRAGPGGTFGGFSLSSVKGTYAATFHGTIDGTGTLTANGAGKITGGTETVNDGTNACVGSLGGSYTVNPDGTGTLTVLRSPPRTPGF